MSIQAPIQGPDSAHSKRARWARWVLVAFVVLGVVLFGRQANERVIVAFSVPPTLYGAGAPIAREDLAAFTARVLDPDGEVVAVSDGVFHGGLQTPLTPEVVWTLPHGTYATRVELRTEDGRRATLTGAVTVEDEGRLRVELR
ncbi:MAG: hypothetical protein H6745_13825 [Deltaproteobacteria bacterium]|nr:hypothetical protein [Deltaproteobacteria bacterium]